MILVDANLLLYATHEELPQHEAAKTWLEGTISQAPRVGLPWPSLLAYIRIGCNPRLFERPPSIEQAWQVVKGWLRQDNVWIPEPTPRHQMVLEELLQAVDKTGLIMDAHLAALAIEHGLVLCSSDGDFARFADLRWENPLARRS
jgi:toxin-antitoxin system PIN domain toxin